MTTKKKSVGVQLLGKNISGELVAILQIRSAWNAEKKCLESWPGGCQVTVHGKLKEGEDFMQALWREISEELGTEILPAVKVLRLIELINKDNPERKIITFGAIANAEILKILLNKPKNKTSGGFKMIKQNEVEKIADLQIFDKNFGVTDENIIAMFPDEKEAVRMAFEKLK
ncbi:hypothetical protein A3H53_00535 [Candidatus Nomurabacteria bacterium RIFCSPLOWO2_02_FULL_40_10]|uniref:Nudix hydrolase domain-containing protein n=2 Tax=Candidatus Nomuraibacteriota TaxID=1752729 RepID=A0A1F6Y087_9BACT|nr:MAG: hypothetical protein A2642_03610 [Candidatus Nomurabacteria bacterium RIFCSPHIGHO2_01_FULL_39_10]OGI99753.1 MAG: hypothetical protein A3H53_00535 [Candidatus Nomurabacteria bacterium RIFCSPLOWO2_02_FULL_40_10]